MKTQKEHYPQVKEHLRLLEARGEAKNRLFLWPVEGRNHPCEHLAFRTYHWNCETINFC